MEPAQLSYIGNEISDLPRPAIVASQYPALRMGLAEAHRRVNLGLVLQAPSELGETHITSARDARYTAGFTKRTCADV